MVKLNLKAQLRKVLGRKVKALRQQAQLPATVYGKGVKSESLALDLKEFVKVYKQAGETGIIDLTLEGAKASKPVLVHNLQLHPVSNELLHVELHQVDLTKKVKVNIPVEIIGEAPAVEQGGVLFTLLDEIEVEALPTDLPEKFEVDISVLTEIGQSILIKDLQYDKAKVTLHIEDLEAPVVKVEEPKEEEEELAPATEAEAPAAEGEAKAEAEGEAKAEAGEKAKTGETKAADKTEAKPAADKKDEPKTEAEKPAKEKSR